MSAASSTAFWENGAPGARNPLKFETLLKFNALWLFELFLSGFLRCNRQVILYFPKYNRVEKVENKSYYSGIFANNSEIPSTQSSIVAKIPD